MFDQYILLFRGGNLAEDTFAYLPGQDNIVEGLPSSPYSIS